MVDDAVLKSAQNGDEHAFARLVAPYRRELRAHCYRMAGSLHDADDLMQDSLLRAWKGLPRFEGRSDLRTWLYKVTTRACLDSLELRSARVLPKQLGPAVGPNDTMGAPRTDPIWLEPCPAELYQDTTLSPEAQLGQRQSVALALLVALQRLPAKQRVVLILRDVVDWEAAECAQLLDLSVAACNSALQRARETLEAETAPSVDHRNRDLDDKTAALLLRYVAAWERADTSQLVALLHEDATLAMPPISEWLQGSAAIGASIAAMVFQPAGPGAFRLVACEANGQPAFAAYQRDPSTGDLRAAALHLLEVRDDRIAGILAFLDPSLFGAFGLPETLVS